MVEKKMGGHLLQSFQGDISDDACAMLRVAFTDQFKFDVGKMNILDAAQVLCVQNSIHPIREYLAQTIHDDVARIDRFFVDYMEAEDTPLNRAIGRLFFVAAVRRVRSPGCKFDTMIILEGIQGTGKSTALRILAGEENFSDQNIFAMDQKTQAEGLQGVWIFEVAELSGMRHADVSAVKALLSRPVDQIRPAYARYRERWPRQSVFIATTNDDRYLKDDTGNRRFLPIKTGMIDLQAIERDRDQLWAEAAELEADGVSIELPKELWDDAKVAQDARMPIDPWLDTLSEIAGTVAENGIERISSKDLFGDLNLNISAGRVKDYDAKHAAKIMRELGWEGPKAIRIRGKVLRGYERPNSSKDGGNYGTDI